MAHSGPSQDDGGFCRREHVPLERVPVGSCIDDATDGVAHEREAYIRGFGRDKGTPGRARGISGRASRAGGPSYLVNVGGCFD